MTNCPKCNQPFPDDASFKQHAVTVHNAPADILTAPQATPIDNRPPGAEAIPMITPVTASVFDEPAPAYQPVGDPHARPRGVQTPTPPETKPEIASTERRPLELTYVWAGNCQECGGTVATTLLKVKGTLFAAAYCSTCNQVKTTREVKPL